MYVVSKSEQAVMEQIMAAVRNRASKATDHVARVGWEPTSRRPVLKFGLKREGEKQGPAFLSIEEGLLVLSFGRYYDEAYGRRRDYEFNLANEEFMHRLADALGITL